MKLIDQFLDHLAAERGFSPHTVDAYRRDLVAFARHLGPAGPPLEEADRERITAFLGRESRRGSSWATVGRRLAALRSFYAFLVAEGTIPSSPARDVPMPRMGERLPKALKPRDVERVLEEGAGSGPLAVRDRAILETFYAAGLRVSELAGLKVTDINFEFGFVRVLGKGSKERVVPLGRRAIAAIRAYMASLRKGKAGRLDPLEALFRSRKGGAMGREAVYRVVRRAAERAGVPKKVGPHSMRHSFASHLITGGADLRAVQEMLGHSSVATTQVYTKVENRWLKELHEKFHPRA